MNRQKKKFKNSFLCDRDYVQTLDSAFENSKQHWFQQAELEAVKNRERRYQQGSGPCNIFILDTSSNLGEDGFIQMIDAFCTIIDEYARHPEVDENVAVVICGRATQFKHDIEYGGPCPLTAAFMLSLGAVIKRTGYSKKIGDFHVHPRFIVISAGMPTDFTLLDNSEEIVIINFLVNRFVIDHLLQMVRNIGKRHPIYCIPVGKNPDMEDIFEIYTKRSLFIPMDEIEEEENSENNKDSVKESDPSMPPLGSRVRKSPDGPWDTLERHIIGTVIKHSKNAGWLIVQWDGGSIDKYRYGLSNEHEYKYDVIVCDVPRILENELIAIGCLVYRGPDWRFHDQDGGEGSIGSVYSATPNGIVDVRWENGTKNNYRFGYDGKFDLSMCDPFSAEANRFLQDQKRRAASKLPESMQYIYTDISSTGIKTKIRQDQVKKKC
ncbi:uncharacterized protein LOC133203060 [Saccostrea echinata]|uniref:uncharacterized protein LOC133203060 n=1 Tax=Saccostrea echinata TaxID=191078 RepID=UPI002A80CE78|nr:uncharacterized protein LOC133203060 [Saccostrea echinata]